ncbi:hypothetical protein KAW50_07415 [candidate division WOR-3 bacterium]|nr:hypothetical protein [candidate division WOR-3 bacterium]
MGTHGSFGILLEDPKDIIYVTENSDGMPENMGESLLSILREDSVEGLLCAMRDVSTRWEDMRLSIASNEDFQEWTYSEWIYLYRHRTDSLLVCYPSPLKETKTDLHILGQNPYDKHPYSIFVLLEIPIKGTENVMDVWHRTRSLKRVGIHLTL